MRALQNCDFCAAEAVGTFETVPPELEPTEAEQRRVVLCGDCKTQLSTLIEPLLARAGANRPDEDATDGPDSRPTPGESIEGESTQDDRTRDSDATSSDPAATDATGGITFEHERTESRTDDDSPTESPTDEPRNAAARTDEPKTDESAADEDAVENRASADRTGSNPAPPAYGKVVRLLRNRTFPMERRAVESLAAGAYDLESHEVEAIIDYALEDGELTESEGELRRP